MMNDIIDPQFDWPMKEPDLYKFIESKYANNASPGQTGTDWSESNIQSYFKIETKTIVQTGQITTEKITIDANTYANVAVTSTSYALKDGYQLSIDITKKTQSYFDYEIEANDAKRNIIILRPEFVGIAINELKNAFTMSL
jgi:hypothetical protein